MNALERYRKDKGLTLATLAEKSGFSSRSLVLKHCRAARIPGEAVLAYHARLGIPLEELRPDLYGPKRPAPPGDGDEAA